MIQTITRPTNRVLAVIFAAFVACALLTWASPARAHSELEASTPAEGASVSTLAEIELTFGEGVTPEFSTYTLTDATKTPVKLGTPRYDTTKTTVTIPLAQMISGGDYTIGYAILSVDGHKVAGTIHFTSTAPMMGHEGHGPDGDRTGPPPSGMPGDRDHDHDGFVPGQSDDNDSGKAIWYALGGALLGAVIVAVIAWLIRRRGKKASTELAEDAVADTATTATEATAPQAQPTQDKPKRAPKKSES